MKRDKTSFFAAFRELYEESLQSIYLNPLIGSVYRNHDDTPERASDSSIESKDSDNTDDDGTSTLTLQRESELTNSKQQDIVTLDNQIVAEVERDESVKNEIHPRRRKDNRDNYVRTPTSHMLAAQCRWNPELSLATYDQLTLVIGAWIDDSTFSEINERYAARLVNNPKAETDAILWFTLNDIEDFCTQQNVHTCEAQPRSLRLQMYHRIKQHVHQLAIGYRNMSLRSRNKET